MRGSSSDQRQRRLRRRSPWRRFRRATRAPRNAVLARAIWLLVRMVGGLPVRLGLALGRGLGAGAHAVLATPRRLARAHVAIAFPALDAAARATLVRQTFRHAGTAFVELALWPKLQVQPGYVTMAGLDVARAALAEGQGLIAVTGHTGHWELLAATMAQHLPLTVVARRVNDARFNALVLRFRRAVGCEVLLRDDPSFLVAARDALRRGRVLALLIDQDTRGAGVFVPFFGRPARTPPGAAILAFRARAPIVTAFIQRRPEGGHHIEISRVDLAVHHGRDRVTTLTAALTTAIETQLRRAPAEWVWWHERWRNQPGT